jgi:hypothetical protein
MHRVDLFALLDHIEPFDATTATTAPLSAGFSEQHPQPSQSGSTHVPGTPAQPGTGKAVLTAQRYPDVQPPVVLEDSGARFNANGEQEFGLSQFPNEVPPSYASH